MTLGEESGGGGEPGEWARRGMYEDQSMECGELDHRVDTGRGFKSLQAQ